MPHSDLRPMTPNSESRFRPHLWPVTPRTGSEVSPSQSARSLLAGRPPPVPQRGLWQVAKG